MSAALTLINWSKVGLFAIVKSGTIFDFWNRAAPKVSKVSSGSRAPRRRWGLGACGRGVTAISARTSFARRLCVWLRSLQDRLLKTPLWQNTEFRLVTVGELVELYFSNPLRDDIQRPTRSERSSTRTYSLARAIIFTCVAASNCLLASDVTIQLDPRFSQRTVTHR
jgi:hypothetical protein